MQFWLWRPWKASYLLGIRNSSTFAISGVCLLWSQVRNLRKFINGTFLKITQLCKHCQRSRTWESQPFIGSFPAGNLLTSASILYSGSSPAKVLRVFSILNCATISLSTFFWHQSSFLIKAVHSVYNCNQNSLINSESEGVTNPSR